MDSSKMSDSAATRTDTIDDAQRIEKEEAQGGAKSGEDARQDDEKAHSPGPRTPTPGPQADAGPEKKADPNSDNLFSVLSLDQASPEQASPKATIESADEGEVQGPLPMESSKHSEKGDDAEKDGEGKGDAEKDGEEKEAERPPSPIKDEQKQDTQPEQETEKSGAKSPEPDLQDARSETSNAARSETSNAAKSETSNAARSTTPRSGNESQQGSTGAEPKDNADAFAAAGLGAVGLGVGTTALAASGAFDDKDESASASKSPDLTGPLEQAEPEGRSDMQHLVDDLERHMRSMISSIKNVFGGLEQVQQHAQQQDQKQEPERGTKSPGADK